MHVEFRMADPGTRPAHHIADVTITLDQEEGRLAGLVITNFAIWGRKDGLPGINITVPSVKRAGEDGTTRFFNILRSAKGTTVITDIRRRILAELCNQHPDVVARYGGFLVEDEGVEEVPAVGTSAA